MRGTLVHSWGREPPSWTVRRVFATGSSPPPLLRRRRPPEARGQIIAQVEECAQLSVSGWQAGLERHAGVGEGTDGCEALPRPWEAEPK